MNNDKDIAMKMNEHFTNIGPSLAANLTDPWTYAGQQIITTMSDTIVVDRLELLKLLKDLNTTKSSAIENLSSRLVKDSLVCLIDQFLFLVNLSFRTGTFPTDCKKAIIIPLPKDGDLSNCNNYRPISLLPVPGKIIEKIYHSRLMSYLEDNHILTDKQGGFRKNNSTINTVANFTHEIYSAVNNHEISLTTFIDFSKAFDTVNHEILLAKLKLLGIKNNNFSWLENYLTDRKQCTLVAGTTSEFMKITCGVPQGSILGPLLFLLYVNDMPDVVKDSSIYLYADDTVLLNYGKNMINVKNDMQRDLGKIASWCGRNKLSLNIKKTKNMLFGSRHKLKRTKCDKLQINDAKLEFVSQYKYLGVILDSNLAFTKHLNNVIRIVSHKINLLAKVRRYLDNRASLLIYKTMILPYFDYGDILFMKSQKHLLSKLDHLQKRALKMCLHITGDVPENILLTSADVAHLGRRREAHILNYMYKNKEKEELLDMKNVNTRSRVAPLFKTVIPSCEKYKNSALYHGAILWNMLTVNIRNIDSFDSFKAHQKKAMKENG